MYIFIGPLQVYLRRSGLSRIDKNGKNAYLLLMIDILTPLRLTLQSFVPSIWLHFVLVQLVSRRYKKLCFSNALQNYIYLLNLLQHFYQFWIDHFYADKLAMAQWICTQLGIGCFCDFYEVNSISVFTIHNTNGCDFWCTIIYGGKCEYAWGKNFI